MPEPSNKSADDVLAIIGREISATQGALLALTAVLARQGEVGAIVEHLLTIRQNAAKEPNSSHFTDLIDKMIDVIRPSLH
jgi:hypothetical protein